jgi:hypothetical protein
MNDQEMMVNMARHATANPDYVAYLLELYGQTEKLEWHDVAEHLGLDDTRFARLALCRRPRKESFGEDVERIAGYIHIEAPRLLVLFRRAETIEAFQARSGRIGRQWLMAARDRDDEGDSDI